jgi:hypothetical protein
VAYDERLAGRIRSALAGRDGIAERKMFGGLCFLVHGRMCCGVLKDELCLRVGPDRYEEALLEPHARPMDFTGRPMRGFVFVAPAGLEADGALAKWLGWASDFAARTPPKGAARRGRGSNNDNTHRRRKR